LVAKRPTKKKKMKNSVFSGFPSIDKITGGFQPGELTFILSRPGQGKSLFAINLVWNNIVNLGMKTKVCFFNMDMKKQEFYRRLNSIKVGKSLPRDEVPTIIWPSNIFIENPLEFALWEKDYPGIYSAIKFVEIRSRMIKKSFGLDLIVVDYLQMVSMGKRMQGSAKKLNAFVTGLKQLAEELKLPIIILANTKHCPQKAAPEKYNRLAFAHKNVLSPLERKKRPLPCDIRGGKAPLKYGSKFLSLYLHDTQHPGVPPETLKFGVENYRRYRNLEVNIWGNNNTYLGRTMLKFHDLQMKFKESKRKKIKLKTISLLGKC